MRYKCFGKMIEVPESLISKYTKDFDVFQNNKSRDEVNELRNSIYEIMLLVQMDPTMLDEPPYMNDFVNSLAMKKALENNKVMFDA